MWMMNWKAWLQLNLELNLELKKTKNWLLIKEHSDFWKTLESDASSEETKIKFLLVEENTESDGTIDAEYRKWEAERRHLMPGFLSISDKIRLGYMEHYAKQGSNCETCQQTIDDKKRRYYPHLCERCGSYLEKVNIAPSVDTSLSKAAY